MPRARDFLSLGQLPPGPLNAITDGHTMPALPVFETLDLLRRCGVAVRNL